MRVLSNQRRYSAQNSTASNVVKASSVTLNARTSGTEANSESWDRKHCNQENFTNCVAVQDAKIGEFRSTLLPV